jgi:Rrf2 family protein
VLTHTSETAIRALIYLSLAGSDRPTPPRLIAEAINCSPTYLLKVLRMLARSGILRSRKGARGGVWLARPPQDVTLLQIVEACQGLIVGNYCQGLGGASTGVCGFHRAMQEVHDATVKTLSRWTLADLVQQPAPAEATSCKMAILVPHRTVSRETAHA